MFPRNSEIDAATFVAPRWHTVAIVTLMVAVAVTGTLISSPGVAATRSRIVFTYLPMIAVQWGLVIYVCRVGRPPGVFAHLFGQRWSTFGRAGADLAIALGVAAIIELVEHVFASSRAAVLPAGAAERLAWVGVAVSAGFCEEVVYRGYLQTQFAAFTHSSALAIALQAALFGLAHGEQGLAPAVRIALYGALFGVVTWWRRSLAPVVIAHVGIDLLSGWAP